jgi:hypothetical protein
MNLSHLTQEELKKLEQKLEKQLFSEVTRFSAVETSFNHCGRRIRA